MFRLKAELGRKQLIILIFVAAVTGLAEGMAVPVYIQEYRNDTYLYATGLPSLEQLSVCFWLFGIPDDDGRRHDTLFSIATTDAPNALSIRFNNQYRALKVRIGGSAAYFPAESASSLDGRFLGWNHHCFTMASEQMFKWYSKSSDAGSEMKLWHSVELDVYTVGVNGSLVLLQDQDSYDGGNQLGGFQLKNTIEGKIALFNMWDFELSYEEITALSCLTQGNLLGMSDLSIMGPANFTLDDVPCTPVKTPNGSGEMFTKWPGVRLEHYVILTLPTETCVSTCILNCITTPDCFSVNFWKLTGLCELNSYNIMLSRLKVADNCIHYSLDSVQ